jgi:hypothetical protein
MRTVYGGSKCVGGAAHALATTIEHVCGDHGRAGVLVSKELLDGADAVAGLEEMGGGRMAQCVTAGGDQEFDRPAVHEIRLGWEYRSLALLLSRRVGFSRAPDPR